MLSGVWTRVPAAALQRSSHTLSVVGNKAYVFGGEIEPRKPVDNKVHVVDLTTGGYDAIEAPGAPPPRVGHAAAVIDKSIYIFSGRGGPAMDALEEHGAVHVFDTTAASWSTLHPDSHTYPRGRSYHCATSAGSSLVIHAGCGDAKTGRLNDVWAFDITTRTWLEMPDAPGDPRGGSTIAYLEKTNSLWRFGGFNGRTEVGGAIDTLAIAQDAVTAEWKSKAFGATEGLSREDAADLARDAATNGPGPRSVCGMHAVDGRLVVAFGEGKPSATGGHDAAGKFWGDVWTYTPATDKWEEVVPRAADKPTPRGWFASDVGAGGIVVQGGLDDDNERLADLWVLRLE